MFYIFIEIEFAPTWTHLATTKSGKSQTSHKERAVIRPNARHEELYWGWGRNFSLIDVFNFSEGFYGHASSSTWRDSRCTDDWNLLVPKNATKVERPFLANLFQTNIRFTEILDNLYVLNVDNPLFFPAAWGCTFSVWTCGELIFYGDQTLLIRLYPNWV